MNQCPYCRRREIELTLCTPEGVYSVCRPCAVQWGLAAKAAVALDDVTKLKRWASLPSTHGR